MDKLAYPLARQPTDLTDSLLKARVTAKSYNNEI